MIPHAAGDPGDRDCSGLRVTRLATASVAAVLWRCVCCVLVAKPVRASGSAGAPRSRSSTGSAPAFSTPYKPWRPRHREHPGPPETSAELMGSVLARLGGHGRAL